MRLHVNEQHDWWESTTFLLKSGFSDSPAKSGFLGRKVHHWRRLSYVDMEGPRGGSLPVPIRLRHAVWHLSSYLCKRGHPTSSVAILTCFPTQYPSASCTQGPRLQRKLRFRGLLGAINSGSNGDVQGMGGWLDWAARMHLQLTSLILEFAIAQVASHSPNVLAWRILIPAGQETEGVWALAKDGDSPRYIPWVFPQTTFHKICYHYPFVIPWLFHSYPIIVP